MEILTPQDLKDQFKDPWIAPYKKVLTMVDQGMVELVEYHPCVSGSQWMVYQYKRSSDLVLDSRRMGISTPTFKSWKSDMNLKPSLRLLE